MGSSMFLIVPGPYIPLCCSYIVVSLVLVAVAIVTLGVCTFPFM